jgi:ABC-type dipeptide/oligopeptide/nickel transport system permease subunit
MATTLNTAGGDPPAVLVSGRRRPSSFKLLLHYLRTKPLGTAGLGIVVVIGLVALFSPLIARYPYAEQHYDAIMAAPSATYFFGTDEFGRDIFPGLWKAPESP